MNPVAQEALGAILRWALTLGAGYLVSHGIWTQSASTTYVEASVVALLTLFWSLWQKYASRLKLMVALAAPSGTTEQQVESIISTGQIETALPHPAPAPPAVGKNVILPSINSPKTLVPQLKIGA